MGVLVVLLAGCAPSATPAPASSEPSAPVTADTAAPTTPPAVPTATSAAPVSPTTSAIPTGNTPTATADARAQVDVTITSALWNPATQSVEVSAFAPVVEADGGCTLTLTSGTATATADGSAFADASSTSCGLLTVPEGELASGTWQAEVSYDSPRTHGTSQTQSVEVP